MPDYDTDTHGLIWYLEDDARLGAAASEAFDQCDAGEIRIHIPSISLVEIVYLEEKGKIPSDLKDRLETELKKGTTGLVVAPLDAAVATAVARVSRASVPDLPDRVIAETALRLGPALISRDHKIILSGLPTLW